MFAIFTSQFAPKPLESPQSAKSERVFNFFTVPFQLEYVKTQYFKNELVDYIVVFTLWSANML